MGAGISRNLQGNIDIGCGIPIIRPVFSARLWKPNRIIPALKIRFNIMSADNQGSYNATVIGREEINPQLVILRVRPDAKLFDFKPGQFGVLGLLGSAPRVAEAAPEEAAAEPDKLIRRAYSIASSSLERRYVEFYLTLITSGQLTPRLFALKHGSR